MKGLCCSLSQSPEFLSPVAPPVPPEHCDNLGHCSAPCAIGSLSHTQLRAFLCCTHSKTGPVSSLQETLSFFHWVVFKICPPGAFPGLADVGRCEHGAHVCRNRGEQMLLQLIHISSQCQPRMDPHEPILKAAAPPRVPHKSRDPTATQLCHYRWLWMNLCGSWHSCTLCTAVMAQTPGESTTRAPEDTDEQWSWAHSGQPCPSLS